MKFTRELGESIRLQKYTCTVICEIIILLIYLLTLVNNKF